MKRKKKTYARRAMRGKSSPAKHAFASKLRRNLTGSEKTLWGHLSKKQLGVWFYSQSLAYGYILDFWCPKAGLAVEVDGGIHVLTKKRDRKRDAVLRCKGILTMRFPNDSVDNNTAAVVAMIKAKVKQRTK